MSKPAGYFTIQGPDCPPHLRERVALSINRDRYKRDATVEYRNESHPAFPKAEMVASFCDGSFIVFGDPR